MEFHQKLQELRKIKKLTQEELADALYVSRTAISKWESGRGYPNIDSLKAISKYFSVSIDDLLSSNELLIIAEEDHNQKEEKRCALIFALLDCSFAAFYALPLFRENAPVGAAAVSLAQIRTDISFVYYFITAATISFGILAFALQNCKHIAKIQRISFLLTISATLLFTICTQPYAAVFSFIFLLIKGFLLIKTK